MNRILSARERRVLARGCRAGRRGPGTHSGSQTRPSSLALIAASRRSPLRYCLAGLPVGYQFKNITDAEVNNLLLEDLIIWTNYEIEVAAYNSAGLGVYSSKVTEWTLQGGGCRVQSQAVAHCAQLPRGVGGLPGRGHGQEGRAVKAEASGYTRTLREVSR